MKNSIPYSASYNLNVISEMKQTIMKTLLSDLDTMKLVYDTADIEVPYKPAQYDRVFPWKRVPLSTEENKSFITYEIETGGAKNNAVRDFYINVYVIVHNTKMVIDRRVAETLDIPDKGVRTDVIADKIDYLLNGNVNLGFDSIELVNSLPFAPIDGFQGRMLRYFVQGWNRWGDKIIWE